MHVSDISRRFIAAAMPQPVSDGPPELFQPVGIAIQSGHTSPASAAHWRAFHRLAASCRESMQTPRRSTTLAPHTHRPRPHPAQALCVVDSDHGRPEYRDKKANSGSLGENVNTRRSPAGALVSEWKRKSRPHPAKFQPRRVPSTTAQHPKAVSLRHRQVQGALRDGSKTRSSLGRRRAR
jgi:hypothetical protein